MPLSNTPSSHRKTDGDPLAGSPDKPVQAVSGTEPETPRDDDVHHELEALQGGVAEARRHSWTDPDPIEPELENFLADTYQWHESVPADDPNRFVPQTTGRRPRSSWR